MTSPTRPHIDFDRIDISGYWLLTTISDDSFIFVLYLKQKNNGLKGYMKRINGHEMTDEVKGKILSGGEIVFTRSRPKSHVQVYCGKLSGTVNRMKMDGTYDMDSKGVFLWEASYLGFPS